MTWTVWDVLITVFGVLHIVGVVGVVVAFRRIVKGPVANTAGRLGAVTEKGRAAAEGALNALNANRGHAASIVRDVHGIVTAIRPPAVTRDLPITYRSLRNNLATLATVRQGLSVLRSAVKKTSAPPGPAAAQTRKARVSLPERLGLVPPAIRHIVRLLPYLRIAGTILKHLKQMKRR
jgi:hypothetical protein